MLDNSHGQAAEAVKANLMLNFPSIIAIFYLGDSQLDLTQYSDIPHQ